jgi:hypothetical protein
MSSIVSGRTEQELRNRKQETGKRTGRGNLENFIKMEQAKIRVSVI